MSAGDYPDALVLGLVIVSQYDEEHGTDFLTAEGRAIVAEFEEVRQDLDSDR